MEAVTLIFFSCRRTNLLRQSYDAFIRHNTYPIQEVIIVNDSADPMIHQELQRTYRDYCKLVLNPENIGLFKSIDVGLSHVRTNYFFLCEDDWMITKSGFLEKSLVIMENDPLIEEVWLADYSKHPLETEIHEVRNVKYVLAQDNYYFQEGFIYGWHGFATACSLKRMNDYLRVPKYGAIVDAWMADPNHNKSIWHREHAIGAEYKKLGYRTAVLIDDEYAVNIGFGQSEYKTGREI